MKREFLQNFKIGEQALSKEVIDAILDENSRDIDAAKSKFADYDDLKTQLAEANTTIEGFKDMDIDAVRREANDWKTKAEEAEKAAAAKIADMAFDHMLSGAVSAAKGKNAKAISALLDLDTLKSSKNQEADIKAALEALKKDNGYLFDEEGTPPPYAGGTGGAKLLGDDTSKMNYTELCAYLQAHPDAKI